MKMYIKILASCLLSSMLLINSSVFAAQKVYLSPSTQEHNIGYGDYGNEEDRMNQIATVTKQWLEAKGFIVYRNDRTKDFNFSISDSNSKNPDVHVAIHSNASGDGTARGCRVFKSNGTNSNLIATKLYNQITAITNVEETVGVQNGDSILSECAQVDAPIGFLEVSFHDNQWDANWIVNHIDLIGEKIGRAIEVYFNAL